MLKKTHSQKKQNQNFEKICCLNPTKKQNTIPQINTQFIWFFHTKFVFTSCFDFSVLFFLFYFFLFFSLILPKKEVEFELIFFFNKIFFLFNKNLKNEKRFFYFFFILFSSLSSLFSLLSKTKTKKLDN